MMMDIICNSINIITMSNRFRINKIFEKKRWNNDIRKNDKKKVYNKRKRIDDIMVNIIV